MGRPPGSVISTARTTVHIQSVSFLFYNSYFEQAGTAFPRAQPYSRRAPLSLLETLLSWAEGCEQCALMPGTHPPQTQPRQECDSLVFPGEEQQDKYSAFNV